MDAPVDARTAQHTFLVERYWPDIDEGRAQALARRLEQAARDMTAEGIEVKHLESILMPIDRVMFSLIAAVDEESARQLAMRVGSPADRIALAMRLG